MKKFLTTILLAAILLATACSDNNTSSVNSQNSSVSHTESNTTSSTDNSSQTSQSIITEAPAENTPNKVDDTLPQCEPGNMVYSLTNTSAIMKGKDGYYYKSNHKIDEMHYSSGIPFYYDNATGKSIVLCSKPQCLHDGNEFCAASAKEDKTISFRSVFSLYNNYIYKLYDQRRIGEDGHLESLYEIKLKRYDLMGNECSDLGSVVKLAEDADEHIASINTHLYHYGKLFYNMTDSEEGELFMFDLETRENKRIFIPPNEEGGRNNGVRGLTADKDYLYYAIRYTKYREGSFMTENDIVYDKTVLRLFNIKTGETQVVSGMPDVYGSFTINDGIVYYTTVDRANNTFSLYSYDIEKDKTTALAEKLQQNNLSIDSLGSSNARVITDRKYLYISTGYHMSRDKESPDYENDFYVYSFDGKQLLHGLDKLPADIPDWSYEYKVLDGEFYMEFQDESRITSDTSDMISGVYMMKTEDLINGSGNWKRLYKEG
ncbi:MAG: hypothetical protein IJ045_05435 [Ruminiclostridium sp.]|nr:hypothetical protein [Ruminiclostridium sp.]